MRVQGPGSNEIEQSYWMRAINWTHGFSVQDQRKVAKCMLNLHVTILEEKPFGSNPGKELKRRAHDLKNQDAS